MQTARKNARELRLLRVNLKSDVFNLLPRICSEVRAASARDLASLLASNSTRLRVALVLGAKVPMHVRQGKLGGLCALPSRKNRENHFKHPNDDEESNRSCTRRSTITIAVCPKSRVSRMLYTHKNANSKFVISTTHCDLCFSCDFAPSRDCALRGLRILLLVPENRS